jgi:hypothetical protein
MDLLGKVSYVGIEWSAGWANIFFNVSQLIPSRRSISHLLLSSLDTSSRIFVHQSIPVQSSPLLWIRESKSLSEEG